MVSDNWHHGTISIIASSSKERFYLLMIVTSLNNEIGKVSCRSIFGIDIRAAVPYVKFVNPITEDRESIVWVAELRKTKRFYMILLRDYSFYADKKL